MYLGRTISYDGTKIHNFNQNMEYPRKILILLCLLCQLVAEAAGFGSIVFSEIMADPSPMVGLPDIEYIELYNRGDVSCSVKGWTLQVGDRGCLLPDVVIRAGGYVVLLSSRVDVSMEVWADIDVALCEGFPALLNAGSDLVLYDELGQRQAAVSYAVDQLLPMFKRSGGWSLECVSLEDWSGSACDWEASLDPCGGSPGRVNSGNRPTSCVELPVCDRVYVPEKNCIELAFTEMLDTNGGERAFLFLESSDRAVLRVETVMPMCRRLRVYLSDTLRAGDWYRLHCRSLQAANGSVLADTLIEVALPLMPDSFQLTLNEVLFNPLSDGYDFVELYNRSESCLDVSRVLLAGADEQGMPGQGWPLSEERLCFYPGTYALVSRSTRTVLESYPKKAVVPDDGITLFLDMSGFPSMGDDAGHILLVSRSGSVLDEMQYDADMHSSLLAHVDGVSLEKVHVDGSSIRSDMWCSAASVVGFATPGYRNSQAGRISVQADTYLQTDADWLSPNSDGDHDVVLMRVRVPNAGIADVSLFHSSGYRVMHILNHVWVGEETLLTWDGRDASGRLLSPGSYVMLLRFFSDRGQRITERKVLHLIP